VRSLLAGEQGLTLAEVLVALTVLSVGLVAMISLLPLAGFGVHEGGYRSGAAFLAWQRLEQIRHAAGTAEPSNDPLAEATVSFPDEPAVAPPHGAFSRSVRVRDCGLGCSGAQTPGVRQVTVTVTYPAGSPQGVSPTQRGAVILSTYIGPR
jgi:prepilin-type N-terminal cleavage/methylation domain-containing protein